jgi:hypothetical protein
MEKQKRRSRMKRQATGRRLVLTPRDLAIFELLERYRYLRSTFIRAFVGGASETRFKERLGDLYHEGGYLNRPERQWETARSRYMPVVYENSERAREVLAMHGRLAERCPHMPYGATGAGRQFVHSLTICEVLAAIELATVADPDLRFIAWPEILAKAPEVARSSTYPLRLPVPSSPAVSGKRAVWNARFVIPDGLFGLEYFVKGQKSYRFFALEVDRGTMPVRRSNCAQSSHLGKLLAYRDIVEGSGHKYWFGIPNLLVLTVATSEPRKANMMSALSDDVGGSAIFLFTATGNLTLSDENRARSGLVCGGHWERRGYPPLDILLESAT